MFYLVVVAAAVVVVNLSSPKWLFRLDLEFVYVRDQEFVV